MIPPLARQFVAGESAATALERARRLNDDGVGAILNLLGEHYDSPAPARADADTYCRLAEDAARAGLRVCLSVKPTQLGLDVSEDCFRGNLDRVVDCASQREVWQYAPCGGKWLSYFYRRVSENLGNATFALRALLSG